MWLSHHGDYKSFYIGAKFPEADFAEFQRTYSKQRKNLIAEQNNETLSPELIFTEADELKLQRYRQAAHEIKLKGSA